MSWSIPRESVELVGPVTVTDNGEPVTSYEVAVVARNGRPDTASWSAPDAAAGSLYVLVGPGTDRELTPGSYRIWGRYTASPEIPVFVIGTLAVT